jgi:hypothetical protein
MTEPRALIAGCVPVQVTFAHSGSTWSAATR